MGIFVMALIMGVVASLMITGSPSFMIVALASAAVGLLTGYISADSANDYKQGVISQLNKLEEIFQETTTTAPRF